MRSNLLRKITSLGAAALLSLSACGSADPLEGGTSDGPSGSADGNAIVVGSQAYYSNEIVAEIYAQALEAEGFTVDRQFQIGQREVYMPEIEAGKIDVFPEYTGNLLQYYSPETSARKAEEVNKELESALPQGIRALTPSEASDQDSYVVTEEFASRHELTTIADLAGIDDLTLGGNSELESRPYGPIGLKDVYGVEVGFTPIEDSGGQLTIKSLRDGAVQLVDIYSANPVLSDGDLRVLEDPQGLFLASQVVPIVSDNVDERAAKVLNRVSASLTQEQLIEMNARSQDEGVPASTIARQWITDHYDK